MKTKIVLLTMFLFLSIDKASAAPTILVRSTYHIYKNSTIIPNNKNDTRNIILLTIDDGPTTRSREIIDILNKHKVKAVFFINGGAHNKETSKIIEEEWEQGFSIGNHTWSHINLKKEKNQEKIKSEINKNTELIKKLTGSQPHFFRPPYAEFNSYIKNLIKKDGMVMMNWSGSASDWEKNTLDEDIFMGNVIDNLHNGEILLLHEYPQTVKYLDKLLTTIKEKGYTFIDPQQVTD